MQLNGMLNKCPKIDVFMLHLPLTRCPHSRLVTKTGGTTEVLVSHLIKG